MKEAAVKSWKTTLAGVAAFVAVLATQCSAQFDADPETVAQWAALVPAGLAMFALIFARDNDVSSEDSGAR